MVFADYANCCAVLSGQWIKYERNIPAEIDLLGWHVYFGDSIWLFWRCVGTKKDPDIR